MQQVRHVCDWVGLHIFLLRSGSQETISTYFHDAHKQYNSAYGNVCGLKKNILHLMMQTVKFFRRNVHKLKTVNVFQGNQMTVRSYMPVRTAKWCSPHWISTSSTFCRKSFAPNNVSGICSGIKLLICLGPLPRMPKPHVNSSLSSASTLQ